MEAALEVTHRVPMMHCGKQVNSAVPSWEYCKNLGHRVLDYWKKQRDDRADQAFSLWGKRGHTENDCWNKEYME